MSTQEKASDDKIRSDTELDIDSLPLADLKVEGGFDMITFEENDTLWDDLLANSKDSFEMAASQTCEVGNHQIDKLVQEMGQLDHDKF